MLSQGISDGAACVILASESAIAKHDLNPLARVAAYGVAGEYLFCALINCDSLIYPSSCHGGGQARVHNLADMIW